MKIEFKFNEKLNCGELIVARWCNYGSYKKLSVFGNFDQASVLEDTGDFIDCLNEINNQLVFPNVSSTAPWNYSINLTKKEICINWAVIKDKGAVERRAARRKQFGLIVPEPRFLDKAVIRLESITGIRIREENEIIDVDYINNTISSNRISPKMIKEEKDINYCKDIVDDIISKIEYNYEKLLENSYIQEKFSKSLFERSLRIEKDPIQNYIVYFDISPEIGELYRYNQRLSSDAQNDVLGYLEKSYNKLLIKNDYKK